jgi:hypothetical protein
MRLYPLPEGVSTGDNGLDRFLENAGVALQGEWQNSKADLDFVGCPTPTESRLSFYGSTLTLSLKWDQEETTLAGAIKLPKIISNSQQRYQCYGSIVFITDGTNLTHLIAEGDTINLPVISGNNLLLTTTMIIKAG